MPALADSILARSRREGDCLIWEGGTISTGYGCVGRGLVHRLVYEAVHGPLPPDVHVHHECRQRRCVELTHLAAIDRAATSQVVVLQ